MERRKVIKRNEEQDGKLGGGKGKMRRDMKLSLSTESCFIELSPKVGETSSTTSVHPQSVDYVFLSTTFLTNCHLLMWSSSWGAKYLICNHSSSSRNLRRRSLHPSLLPWFYMTQRSSCFLSGEFDDDYDDLIAARIWEKKLLLEHPFNPRKHIFRVTFIESCNYKIVAVTSVSHLTIHLFSIISFVLRLNWKDESSLSKSKTRTIILCINITSNKIKPSLFDRHEITHHLRVKFMSNFPNCGLFKFSSFSVICIEPPTCNNGSPSR